MVCRFKVINLEFKYKNVVGIIARRLQKSAPGKDQSFREPLIHARSLSVASVFFAKSHLGTGVGHWHYGWS